MISFIFFVSKVDEKVDQLLTGFLTLTLIALAKNPLCKRHISFYLVFWII